jgi:deazaflavin-dependent oxidoreductase (nitroreductase family)
MALVEHNEKPSQTESVPRVFPLQDTMLYNMIFKPEFRQTFHGRIKFLNRLVVPLYRIGVLPLLGVGRSTLLLTTKGRTSGRMRHFPIGYHRIDGTVVVFSGWAKDANWYKNMTANPDEVYVQIGFHRFHARPEVVTDPQALRGILEQFVRQNPKEARRMMGWDAQRDDPATADFSIMMEKVLTARFHVLAAY